jgi:dTDP-4-amino-4,6-dideoxygalactose transaminase
MNLFSKKIPRGVIYHSLMQSVSYLARAMCMPLDDEKKVREFESAFASHCERTHCVAFSFARTAIHTVLKSLDLPKGSEVILPPITIKGILDVVVDLGLVPRYVDLDPNTICFRMDALRSKVGPATKAVIVTPLFGLVPEMDEMMRLFRERGIFVIEDFSQCLNGRFDGKRIGTFGDVGIYSSSSIKTLDTLGGGLAVTDDERLHEALRKGQAELQAPSRAFLVKKAWLNLVRNAATTQPWFSLLTYPVLQFIRNRNPEAALKQTGHRDKNRLAKLPAPWFYRYTSVQAGIGLENIGKVGTADAARVANVEFVKSLSGSRLFPSTTARSANVYWQLIMLSPDSMSAQSFFAGHGVDIATSSLELICALKDYPNREELREADRIYRNGIFIPCYPTLSRLDMERVAAAVREFFDAND